MKKILQVVGGLVGLLALGAMIIALVLSLRGQQTRIMPGSAMFQSPIRESTSTPPPSEHITPVPIPTLALPIPSVVTGPPVTTREGNTYRLVAVPRDTPRARGELCDLSIAPDGRLAAVSMCATEGIISDVFIVDIATGTGARIGIPLSTSGPDQRLLGLKETWFRGWFPDSARVLLMSDLLQIYDIKSGQGQRVSPEGEIVTDAAVSPDGKVIAYTTIEGGSLRIIDLEGHLVQEIPAPSPKPGVRPESITWSPDGQFVVYVWDRIVGQFNLWGSLWGAEVASGKQWQLSPDGVYDGFPVWSPQGNEVLITRRENMEDSSADFALLRLVSNLWIVDVKSGEWRQLTTLNGQGAWSPKWTPDATAVVFESNLERSLDAWMINSDSTSLQRLTFDSRMMSRGLALLP